MRALASIGAGALMRHAAAVRGLFIALAIVGFAGWSARVATAEAAAVAAAEPAAACRRPQPASYAAQAAAVHRASLVVTFGNGTPTMRFCIEFTEASISGLDLLQRSGLPVVTSGGGLGAAVCAIDGVGSTDGSSYSTCLGRGSYWAYFQYAAGAWRLSPVGASTTVVSDGAVEGWAFGNNAKPDPPGTICPQPTATPTPPPTPTPLPPTPSPAASPAPAASAPTSAATSPVLAPATAVAPVPPVATATPLLPAPGPPMSEVRGVQATPTPAATQVPPHTPGPVPSLSATASPTAASGIIVGAAQGRANAERAATGGATLSSTAVRSLVEFLIVAAALGALAALMFRRRRQRHV